MNSPRGRHVGIPVLDLNKCLTFYETLLGFKVKSRELEEGPFLETILGIPGGKAEIAKLITDSGWMLELLQYLSPLGTPATGKRVNSPGHAHIALTVSNLDQQYSRLLVSGVKFVSPPQISPNGRAKVAFCEDPEGNFVELVEEIP